MVASTSSKLAHRQARAAAAAFLDEEDAELLRQRAERRNRVAENIGQIAANDEQSVKLTARLEELKAETARQIEQLDLENSRLMAAVVGDGVSAQKLSELTGHEEKEVKAAVKSARAESAKPAAEVKVPAARAKSTAAAESPALAEQPAA